MSGPAPASAQLPGTGDIIDGKYALERLLGKGGMGAVYAARHLKLGHAVAIKVMLADTANHEAAQRFVNEGRAAANIQNDHVVRVSDVDEENGYAYMVLELLEGEDLAQVLERETRLPAHVAVGYAIQALEGVRQAHAQGIVHRDLKPSNLFLASRPNGSVVLKVLDFGISKANSTSPLGQTPGSLTSTKAMLGSPLYMSPEQLRSSKSVDARADIWAIGVILFELITGTLPFVGENLGELFAAILETEPASLRSHVPDVPPGLDAIVLKCLQRRPENRFQTAAELERELAPFASAGGAGHTLVHHPGSHGALHGGPGLGPPADHPPPGRGPFPSSPSSSAAGSSAHAGSSGGFQPLGPPARGATVALGQMTPMPHGSRELHQAGMPPPGGAVTPMPMGHQTGSTWQNTGSAAVPVKSSSTPLLIGLVCAAFALGGIGLAGFATYRSQHRAAGSSSPSSSVGASALVPPPAPLASDAAPVTSAQAVASASAAPAASAPPAASASAVAGSHAGGSSGSAGSSGAGGSGAGGRAHAPVAASPVVKVEPRSPAVVAAEAPRPATPPPPVAPVAPRPAAPTSGTLQGAR